MQLNDFPFAMLVHTSAVMAMQSTWCSKVHAYFVAWETRKTVSRFKVSDQLLKTSPIHKIDRTIICVFKLLITADCSGEQTQLFVKSSSFAWLACQPLALFGRIFFRMLPFQALFY